MAKVKCINCGRFVAETTDKFKPGVRPNGSMLRLAEPYASRGWVKVIRWSEATMCAMIFCPQCEYPLAPNGSFTLADVDRVSEAAKARQAAIDAAEEGPEEEEACPKCGKPASGFKSRSGFVNHCRMCRGSG